MKLFKHKKQKQIDDIMIKEFGFKDNTMEITMQHPEFAIMTEGLVKYFKECGGVNYVEVGAYHEELGPFVITVQRKHGKTPAQLKTEAETERDKYKAQRDTLIEGVEMAIATIDDKQYPATHRALVYNLNKIKEG